MEFILAAIIAIAVLAFVAYPLFATAEEEPAETLGTFEGLIAQRNAAYDAIRDLDFDFQMGKLSRDDYAGRRDKYVARAAHILEEMDALDGGRAGETVEAEVARLRAAKDAHAAAGDAIEREVARLRARKRNPSL